MRRSKRSGKSPSREVGEPGNFRRIMRRRRSGGRRRSCVWSTPIGMKCYRPGYCRWVSELRRRAEQDLGSRRTAMRSRRPADADVGQCAAATVITQQSGGGQVGDTFWPMLIHLSSTRPVLSDRDARAGATIFCAPSYRRPFQRSERAQDIALCRGGIVRRRSGECGYAHRRRHTVRIRWWQACRRLRM